MGKSKELIARRLNGCNAYEVAYVAGCTPQTVYNWVWGRGGRYLGPAIEAAIEELSKTQNNITNEESEKQHEQLTPEQVEVFDWGVFELHVDIDFHLTVTAWVNISGEQFKLEKVTPYRASVKLPRAARILEACGAIEIYRIDYGDYTITTVCDDEGGVRTDSLYNLIDDILYDNLDAFICEMWNCPGERSEYIQELTEATPA